MPIPLLSLLIPAFSLCALAICLISVSVRRRTREAERAHRREIQRRELDFRRQTLRTVTGGRLVLCGAEEVSGMLEGERLWTLPLLEASDVSLFRQHLREIAIRRGFAQARLDDLCSCVAEAAGNAIRYSQGGVAQVWAADDGFSVLVTDCGAGISAEALLGRLESLPGTLPEDICSAGMGFRLMLAMSDTLALSTGVDGTQLLLKVHNAAPSNPMKWSEEQLLFRLAEKPSAPSTLATFPC